MYYEDFKKEIKKDKYDNPMRVDDDFVYKFWVCHCALNSLELQEEQKKVGEKDEKNTTI